MKQAELRQLADCCVCQKKVGHTGLPLFWKVTIERFGIDAKAVRRQDGLGAFLGSHALAAVMGPDEDVAIPCSDVVIVSVCEDCALNGSLPVGQVALSRQG